MAIEDSIGARASAERLHQISLFVRGYPPAKNEAQSVMSPRHPHASRVRLLLVAAARALADSAFVPVKTGPVALDLVVYAAPDQPPWDATNYLGGVADVLEDKVRRGGLPHLGDLESIWLYRDDRQIKVITYREVPASQPSYIVAVRRIEPIETT